MPSAVQPAAPSGPAATYLTSRQVLARYGRKDLTWLWRRRQNDPAFPKPIKIAKLRYWSLASLQAYEADLAARADAA
jgi:predicted DNA-binding transcriptional regulator AlpA